MMTGKKPKTLKEVFEIVDGKKDDSRMYLAGFDEILTEKQLADAFRVVSKASDSHMMFIPFKYLLRGTGPTVAVEGWREHTRIVESPTGEQTTDTVHSFSGPMIQQKTLTLDEFLDSVSSGNTNYKDNKLTIKHKYYHGSGAEEEHIYDIRMLIPATNSEAYSLCIMLDDEDFLGNKTEHIQVLSNETIAHVYETRGEFRQHFEEDGALRHAGSVPCDTHPGNNLPSRPIKGFHRVRTPRRGR